MQIIHQMQSDVVPGGLLSGVASPLWSEQRRGDDGDPICSAVGRLSRCDDDGVRQVIAELVAKPMEVAYVSLVGCLTELHLDCEDRSSTLDDEVYLTVAAPGAQVAGPRLGRLGVDTDAERDQRLEQSPEESPLAGHRGAGWLRLQQRGRIDAEQAGRKRWIGEVVLWR